MVIPRFTRLAILCLLMLVSAARADSPAKQPKLPKVLILGDSISIGYTPVVRQNLAGRAEVTRPKVNCQHSANGLAQLKKWLGNEKWDVIHFNFGIWDTHMLSASQQLVLDEANAKGPLHIRHTPEQYRANLTKIVEILEGTGAKLVFASSTPIMSRSGDRFEDIVRLNRVALEVMQQHKIPVNDLYAKSLPNAAKWQTNDKVHFNGEGNAQLGKLVSDAILQQLPAGKVVPVPAK